MGKKEKNMTTQVKIGLGCAGVLLALGLVAAGGHMVQRHGPGGSEPWNGPMLEPIFDRLDLSTDQRAQVRQILDRRGDEIRDGLAAVRTAHVVLFDRVHADDLDETAIREAAGALGEAEANVAVIHASILHEARQVLTPEQRVEATRLLAEHRARMQSGMGFPGHFHGGPGRWHGGPSESHAVEGQSQ